MKRSILQTRFAVQKVHPEVGQGLFATEWIKKGVFVLEYTGKKVPTKRADTMKSRYLFEIDRKWTVDGSSRANLARYINHSCAPNCEASISKGKILVHTQRDIARGEELTIDYGEEYFDEYIKPAGCRCARCRMRAFVTAEEMVL
ncbi:hypothetical protein A2673_01690 [Candidatus Kaiserbacteria bacterium RIFCSPHIGHO2_01_FULL_50_13]|uniref:SET domain-containing protein n=1 Tax=Candidatus Kaiserbacteria bacterium RIFCSPLOWO2_01_FULL_50_24 TaxID=1798507 RepID=A0A1F6ENE8_9BACT|nr:MAG: hypothetical protein A2673_01690 [Candidatus Kaiserbacteria bacterium RIFCSPHIGHO2_01_FULL_50_13]OGG74832.1 MAG: hypothetical protein A3A34_00390 [Candidatus Kaiserbacteria bacterium RIFCSPLOWO2_01_FULL_50_24]OGG81415.1 MAG: hypothetical protein A3H74_03175 [Candidatus Kaiserbacteria bacterium RIFCSPLOWO2_02_FULL_51_13]